MADNENLESWLELFDVEKKQIITKARLADIRFIPRIGEHIFIPLHEPESWVSYTVIDIEYFLAYDRSHGLVSQSSGRVTVYVKGSAEKQVGGKS